MRAGSITWASICSPVPTVCTEPPWHIRFVIMARALRLTPLSTANFNVQRKPWQVQMTRNTASARKTLNCDRELGTLCGHHYVHLFQRCARSLPWHIRFVIMARTLRLKPLSTANFNVQRKPCQVHVTRITTSDRKTPTESWEHHVGITMITCSNGVHGASRGTSDL